VVTSCQWLLRCCLFDLVVAGCCVFAYLELDVEVVRISARFQSRRMMFSESVAMIQGRRGFLVAGSSTSMVLPATLQTCSSICCMIWSWAIPNLYDSGLRAKNHVKVSLLVPAGVLTMLESRLQVTHSQHRDLIDDQPRTCSRRLSSKERLERAAIALFVTTKERNEDIQATGPIMHHDSTTSPLKQ
jgi:hypothetical protein